MYTSVSGECKLAANDRHSTAGGLGFAAKEGVDYLEINCVNDHDLCWNTKKGILNMGWADMAYLGIASEDCRGLCENAPFRCHTYDWFSDGGRNVCRLSHHSTRTLTQIEDPYFADDFIPAVTRFELGSCQKANDVGSSGGLFWYFIPQVPWSSGPLRTYWLGR